MEDKILVRSYNVGCGDCFYVRIPNGDDGFHILIDCGTKESEGEKKILRRVIRHLMGKEEDEKNDYILPDSKLENKEKRLDLIVVTHRHEDHIKGFDRKYFKKIEIKNLWVTAAMDEGHDHAKGSFEVNKLAFSKIQELLESGAELSPELQELASLYSIGNEGATKALLKFFKEDNPDLKLHFVFAGKTSDDYGIDIKDTKIIVLAPENDIDGYYLGEEADQSLRGMQDGVAYFKENIDLDKDQSPTNISRSEFVALQSRMLSNALAFSVLDDDIQNNVSVVLLIEWRRTHRLLFVGDAMWDGEYMEGKKNGSWNVMWKERSTHLEKAVDFLKVGHHGSHNSTPWNRDADKNHEVNQILNSILPLPEGNQMINAQAIVSTKRNKYETIPDAKLVVEIGKRVRNTTIYLEDIKKRFIDGFEGTEEEAEKAFDPETKIYRYSYIKEYEGNGSKEVGEKGFLDQSQPFRTDMESEGYGQKGTPTNKAEYIDVLVPPDD